MSSDFIYAWKKWMHVGSLVWTALYISAMRCLYTEAKQHSLFKLFVKIQRVIVYFSQWLQDMLHPLQSAVCEAHILQMGAPGLLCDAYWYHKLSCC